MIGDLFQIDTDSHSVVLRRVTRLIRGGLLDEKKRKGLRPTIKIHAIDSREVKKPPLPVVAGVTNEK